MRIIHSCRRSRSAESLPCRPRCEADRSSWRRSSRYDACVRKMRKGTAMENKDIRAALDRHWAASDANNFDEEHQIYREDAVLEYPQSESASAVGATFRHLVSLSQTKSASLYGGYWVLPTYGSLNSSLLTMGSRLIR